MSTGGCSYCRDIVAVEVAYPGREPGWPGRRCRVCHRPYAAVVVQFEREPRVIVAERLAVGLDGPAVVHVPAAACREI